MSGDACTDDRRLAAARLVAAHDAALRRTARRHSLCGADAEDAYQRALLVALRKAPEIGPAALARWMHAVVRNEARAVRRASERSLGGPASGRPGAREVALAAVPSEDSEPFEVAQSRERVVRTARALATLKPQERRALALLAAGLSYAEIGELTGWSYTKVNRCLAEGRSALRDRMVRLEAVR
jgi:RNA polymerase sigma factor (sigma-70 family)